MTACPYGEEALQEFDGVCNPMGDACRDCSDCACDHWDGLCPCDRADCPDPDRAVFASMQMEEMP